MKVLIACEESQTVCKAFRERGHEAYSCDIQEPSGGHPEWHIVGLRIYDQPRKLSEFTGLRNTRFGAAPYDIKRPPQSWCYVEEWEGKKNG